MPLALSLPRHATWLAVDRARRDQEWSLSPRLEAVVSTGRWPRSWAACGSARTGAAMSTSVEPGRSTPRAVRRFATSVTHATCSRPSVHWSLRGSICGAPSIDGCQPAQALTGSIAGSIAGCAACASVWSPASEAPGISGSSSAGARAMDISRAGGRTAVCTRSTTRRSTSGLPGWRPSGSSRQRGDGTSSRR